MARTERLVGRRRHHVKILRGRPISRVRSRCYDSAHIAVRIQRGGGTGPLKPRQPSRASGKRWQFHQAPTIGLGDAVRASPPRSLRRTTRAEVFPYAGRCPEVQGVLDHLPARGALRLRALLRPARGRLPRARRATPPSSSAASRRARTRSGATPTSCRSRAPPRSALPTGWTPLVRADRLAERLGLGELWVKNETANPTHSFKDRVVSVALARAQELGFDDDRLRLDRQPRQRRRRARRRRRPGVLRPHPGRPRAGEDPRHRRLRHQRRRRPRQLRRRQPALHRDRGRARRGRS